MKKNKSTFLFSNLNLNIIGRKEIAAAENKDSGPLQPLVDLVPSNFVSAASDNKNMLQVIFFSIPHSDKKFIAISLFLFFNKFSA